MVRARHLRPPSWQPLVGWESRGIGGGFGGVWGELSCPECHQVCWSLLWSPRCEMVTAAEVRGKENALPLLRPHSQHHPRARATSWHHHPYPRKAGVLPVPHPRGCDPRVAPWTSLLQCLEHCSLDTAAPWPVFSCRSQLASVQPPPTRCESSPSGAQRRCMKCSVCLMDVTMHLLEPDGFFLSPPCSVLPWSLILRVQFSTCK